MPLREIKSPNSSTGTRPERPWGVKHSAVYGQRGDAAPKPSGPPRGSAPGEPIDGQITISKGANQ
jgi:hypothetical protein